MLTEIRRETLAVSAGKKEIYPLHHAGVILLEKLLYYLVLGYFGQSLTGIEHQYPALVMPIMFQECSMICVMSAVCNQELGEKTLGALTHM